MGSVAVVFSRGLAGLDAPLVRVEAHVGGGLPQFHIFDGPRTDVSDITTYTYFSPTDSCMACRGRIATITNPLGQVTSYTNYNADGRPLSITDANGVVTSLGYSARGWLSSVAKAGETTSYEYDVAGNFTRVTMPDGSWKHYSYDGADGLIGVDDSIGNAIDYALDVKGNVVETNVYDPLDQLRRTMQSVHDTANRLAEDFGASGQQTVYQWDNNNNLTSVTDPLAHVTTRSYDALDRTSSISAAGGSTNFTYTSKDQPATVQDPRGLTTTYTYNGLADLTQLASPDTGTATLTYDAAGNVATRTDSRGAVTTYSYDALNRLLSSSVTDGAVSYEYDNVMTGGAFANGRLTKLTDPSGTTAYVYDSLGRITTKTQSVAASPSNKVFTIGYAYSSGRLSAITYPSGRVVLYGFNAAAQPTTASVDGTTVLSSGEYFPFGSVKKWVWANGEVMDRGYDLDGRVKTLTLGPSTATYADLSQVFGYDALNRLVSANLAAGQTQTFTYDANGNRTNATINSASTTYTYPGANGRLSSLSGATTRSFVYDNSGNVTGSAGVTYVYDGRGRLKQAGTAAYLLNGIGQRVKKSTAGDTYFAYDEGGHLLGEYDSSGTTIEETVWVGDVPAAVMKPKSPSGFDVFYVWADHLNTPRLISDSLNQSRWEWPANDPFGNNSPNENPAGLGNFTYNLRLPGQYYDGETSLAYNYLRDYDPTIGRYVQSDPIGLTGGLNSYLYVGGNPVSRVDPSGLYWFQQPWQAADPIVGRYDTFVSPGGGISSFIERYVPAGRTLAEIHDPLVDGLTGAGVPDALANIPTMPLAYYVAYNLEWLRTFGLVKQPIAECRP